MGISTCSAVFVCGYTQYLFGCASIIAWIILWTEEPGGLQSWGHKDPDMTGWHPEHAPMPFCFVFFLTSGQYVSSMPPTFFLSILKQLPETHVTDKDICSALQCYVGFCHTTRWISHKYTYTPSLSLAPFPPHLIPLGLHRVPGWAHTSYLFYTW